MLRFRLKSIKQSIYRVIRRQNMPGEDIAFSLGINNFYKLTIVVESTKCF